MRRVKSKTHIFSSASHQEGEDGEALEVDGELVAVLEHVLGDEVAHAVQHGGGHRLGEHLLLKTGKGTSAGACETVG